MHLVILLPLVDHAHDANRFSSKEGHGCHRFLQCTLKKIMQHGNSSILSYDTTLKTLCAARKERKKGIFWLR